MNEIMAIEFNMFSFGIGMLVGGIISGIQYWYKNKDNLPKG